MRVESVRQDYDVEVTWLPFELHAEIPADGWHLSAQVQEHFEGRFAWLQEQARAGDIEFVRPSMIPNSRRALEAAEYAREQGRHDQFHKVVFRQVFAEGRDIGQWQTLRAAATEAGLDAVAMQRETESGRYKPIVEQHKATAIEMGATGAPLFIFDDRYVVLGLQPAAAFREVLERLAEENQ